MNAPSLSRHPASATFVCAGCGATEGSRLLYRKNGCAIYRCTHCGVGHANATDMEIAKAHAQKGLDATSGSPFRDPVAIRRCRPVFDQSIGQAQDLLPYFRMIHIGGMDTYAGESRPSELAG